MTSSPLPSSSQYQGSSRMDPENAEQSSCGNISYIPDVDREMKPYVGQQFDSLEEVHESYNGYAKKAGFSVRVNSSRKSKTGNEILRKEYVCSKEGFRKNYQSTEPKRHRGDTREGCMAKLAVVKSGLGRYEVSLFIERHSHALSTPRRIHLLRSHRKMTSVHKCLTQQLDATNITPSQQMGIFEIQAEGVQNVGFVQKDLYNNRVKIKSMVKGHDANMLSEYFIEEQEKNPSFYYIISSEDDGRITKCFWTDATSRKAFRAFGDVIVFDTTYNTNRYGMIFAPFVGVNRHRQTILFGSAFLSDETTESFVWLLEQFKEAMSGDDPKMIITDQDLAMGKAISRVFPYSFHRYCCWHILNKFSEKISPVVYNAYFRYFQKCIWNSHTTEEFEAEWMDVVSMANLADNDWLKGVYDIRAKWVPAFVNHVFSAGMASSQRAESNHSFFKRYVSKENSLMDFILRFNRAVSRQRHEELKADNIDMVERPKLRLPLEMEKQMAEIYTREIFYLFEEEVWNALELDVEDDGEDENFRVYKVVGPNVFAVHCEKKSNFASCICKKFDSDGIPCAHIIAVLRYLRIKSLPDFYILKRWTKASKRDRAVDEVGVQLRDCQDKSVLLRRTTLLQLAHTAIDKAVFNEEIYKFLSDQLEVMLEKIKSFANSYVGERVSNKISSVQQRNFKEPLQVRAKGCGKRLKRGKEMAKKRVEVKGRQCNGCGLAGQSHDKRNCPVLMNRSVEITETSNNSSSSIECSLSV